MQLGKFFQKHHSKSQLEKKIVPITHDYGLSILDTVLCTQDYGWYTKPSKKVILTNPKECENKITVLGLVNEWKNTGHSEWEFLLAGWFVKCVLEALKNKSEEADITVLFNKDFLARKSLFFTKEQVYEHLIPYFNVIKETDDELRLEFRFN